MKVEKLIGIAIAFVMGASYFADGEATGSTPVSSSVIIFYRSDCPQIWFELPTCTSIETSTYGKMEIDLVDTAFWPGKLRCLSFGIDTNRTVLIDQSGEVLAIEGLMSTDELKRLVEHRSSKASFLPELRAKANSSPENTAALWGLYYAERSAGNRSVAANLLNQLAKLDAGFQSLEAERYRVTSLFSKVVASDREAIRRINNQLLELESSIETPLGLRAISGSLAVSFHKLGDQENASKWLAIRWENRLTWEGRSFARRYLRNAVGDDFASFDKHLIDALRICAGLAVD